MISKFLFGILGYTNKHLFVFKNFNFRLAALVSGENWVDICLESSGNRCCAKDDTGRKIRTISTVQFDVNNCFRNGLRVWRQTFVLDYEAARLAEIRKKYKNSCTFIGNWVDLDLICRTERNGARFVCIFLNIVSHNKFFRLAVFESKRENDCVAKYLIKEFEDTTAKDYAIGKNLQLMKIFKIMFV